MRFARTIAVALTAISATACTGGPSDLGQSPDILWWTDHETGDLSDWVRNGGSTYTSGGQLDIVTSPVRSGRYALRSGITSSSGTLSAAIVQRDGSMPREAYYSAWYYVPVAATATSYWLFSKFRQLCTPDASSTDSEAWDLDFLPDRTGAPGMQFQLFSHLSPIREIATASVPIGRWFQVEAFLRAANDNTGQLTVWEDGTQIFDIQNQPTLTTADPTLPTTCIEWTVGGITGTITPSSATFYVDDAAISTHRLGPDYPIFWRGN